MPHMDGHDNLSWTMALPLSLPRLSFDSFLPSFPQGPEWRLVPSGHCRLPGSDSNPLVVRIAQKVRGGGGSKGLGEKASHSDPTPHVSPIHDGLTCEMMESTSMEGVPSHH